MMHLFYTLRPAQWIKNLFVFLPLIFGKKLLAFPENLNTAIAFCLFSLAASAAYTINDILDIEKDRLHPVKRLRPVASGKISIERAWMLAAALLAVSLAAAFLLKPRLGMILTAYVVLNILYSKILKNVVIIDVFCIAFFFLLRIMAGSVSAKVELSHWIIFMIVLLALFLGFNKRRQEIILLTDKHKRSGHREVLSRYNPYFIDQICSVITASIVIVYMLYTVDSKTEAFFGTEHMIYTIPFVFYGIFRYLYILHGRHWKEGDPTRIILKDKKLQLDILLWIATCVAVIYFHL